MLANMTSYVLARHWRPTPIYEALLEQDGIHLPSRHMAEDVESLRLDQISKGRHPLRSYRPNARADEVVNGRLADPTQLVFPVVDETGKVVGIITPDEMAILASEPELLPLVNAADLMRPTVSVELDDDLGSALQAMISSGLPQLPVTDRDGRCVGFITEADIARAYARVTPPKSLPDAGEESTATE
jgi:CIC family chloride channel protein